MREDEVLYWEEVASGRTRNITDNIWKRQEIVRRMLKIPWYKTNILEIGVGIGNAIAAIQCITLGNFKYIGTDLSSTFCKNLKRMWGLNAVQTDILTLPPGKFDRVIALDSLEHVKPEDRVQGYLQIKDRLAEHATMLINMPLSETQHDLRYDHSFTMEDIQEICMVTGLHVDYAERYSIYIPTSARTINYRWVVLQK